MECQYELTDRLAFYLCGRKPGECGGPGGGMGGGGGSAPVVGGTGPKLTTPLFAQTTRTGTTSSRRWLTGECPAPAAPLPCPMSPPASPLGRGGDPGHLPVTGTGASLGGRAGGGPRARAFNDRLYPVLPSAAFSGAQGAPKVHGTEVLSAWLSAPGGPSCAAGAGSPLQPRPFGPARHPGGTRGGGSPSCPLPPLTPPCLPASPAR